MKKTRKHYTAEEKVAILRRHLLEQEPVSKLCDELGLQPTVFYRWQKEFFENGAAAFQTRGRSNQQPQQERIEYLEKKIQRKDEVLAELMGEHIAFTLNRHKGCGGRLQRIRTLLLGRPCRERPDAHLEAARNRPMRGLERARPRGQRKNRIRTILPIVVGPIQLAAQLARLAWRKHDLSNIARRTPGWSPARLRSLVDRAILLANGDPIEEPHLVEALESAGGQDRPAVDRVAWDDVVLPQRITDDLQTLIRLMEPGAAERLSLPTPTGLILLGAPGTGKTMTAKLIASQSNRSFYSIPPSEVLSGAVGGSVKRLTDVFARAKENAPSILFFDEMDGLFPSVQGPVGHHDVQLVEQALIEISALKPEHNVFLIGTTNYLDRVDPRILRGGRFSEKIEIGVPDEAGYRKLLERYLGTAQLANGLTPETILERVQGMSPADLEATINTMKRVAMRRMAPAEAQLPPLQAEDLEEALGRVQSRFRGRRSAQNRPQYFHYMAVTRPGG